MGDSQKKGGGDSGYDPYANRNVEFPLTNMDALMSCLRCAIGTGVLAMPIAISNAGYINGFIGTCMFGFLIGLSITILIKGRYIVCKRESIPMMSYNETMTLGMGYGPPCLRSCGPLASSKTAGEFGATFSFRTFSKVLICAITFFSVWIILSLSNRIMVDFFLFLYYYGVCGVYIVFMAETTKQIMDHYVKSMTLDSRVYMAILGLPLLIVFMIRDLKKLVPFSTAANVLMALGFCGVMYYILRGLPPLSTIVAFQSLERYALFFGTVIFGLQSIGVMLAIEAQMENPQAYLGWFGILSIGMFIITVLYAIIGVCGYWRYGENIMGSVTLNIPEKEIWSILHYALWNFKCLTKDYNFSVPQIVKVMFGISIFFTYPLQGYVSIETVYRNHLAKKISEENVTKFEYVARIIFVILTVIAAIAVPNLGLFLSLTGALSISFLGLVFPGLLDICVKYETGYGPVGIWLIRDIILILFGVAGFVLGSGIAIRDIINTYA